jgi:uncharacterized protein (TIGR02246 family)
MKRIAHFGMLVMLIVSALTAAVALAGENEVPVERQAIEQGNEAFMAAFASHAAAALAGFYTEDGKLLPPNAPIMEGRAAIQAFWQAVIDMGIAAAELDILEVDALGNTAVEVSYYRLYLADGTLADAGKYIVEWKRVSGQWYLHRDIFNSGQ